MSAPSTPSKSSNGADGFISNAFTTDAPTSTGRSFDFGWRLKAKLPKVLQNPMASISSVVDVVDSALFSVVESNVLEVQEVRAGAALRSNGAQMPYL
ncbi:hypothetical protein QR680_002925 [Steinernema hermaphroditum]|uniref:Uncharacterized protein n=1 Tax=Steinernema hermaphroditum TaxID=289476 RepID=A0AA39H4M1_9BILA|nr:hypothetical protein QR680_002925 [Steinernema hermaphroditum]